ncbi:MAG: glutaredoxin [Myxococcaceae bacterium]|nr:glutaredoxin [Myxococcaceae bacterium]
MIPPRPPLHPAVVAAQQAYHADLVNEVAAAVAAHEVVVVGVSGLAPGRRARAYLDAASIPYKYLQYGSYFSGWRRRLALKMWVGWSTFPLVFVRGTFIGGASDLKRLLDSGELAALRALPVGAAAARG